MPRLVPVSVHRIVEQLSGSPVAVCDASWQLLHADAGDVILLIGYLSRLDEDEWDRRAHRPLHIVLDGLRRR